MGGKEGFTYTISSLFRDYTVAHGVANSFKIHSNNLNACELVPASIAAT